MLRRLMTACGLSLVAGSAFGQGIDFSLSEDSAQVQYMAPLQMGNYSRTEYDIRLLYRDDDPDNTVVSGGVTVTGDAGTDAPGLKFGIGVHGHYADMGNHDIGAITLGAEARYAPPPVSRFFLAGGIRYAPKIVTFNDAEEYWETFARLGYEVLPDAEAYVGYRKIEADIDGGPDAKADEGGHVGIRLMF